MRTVRIRYTINDSLMKTIAAEALKRHCSITELFLYLLRVGYGNRFKAASNRYAALISVFQAAHIARMLKR